MGKRFLLIGWVLLMGLFSVNAIAATATFKVGHDYAGGINFKLDQTSYYGEGAGNIVGSTLTLASDPNKVIKLDFTYCIDVLHNIYLNGSYFAKVSDTSHGSLAIESRPEITTVNGERIAWLMTHEAKLATTKAQQAGLQAAIWAQVYGSRFTLLNTATSAIGTAYNYFIAQLGNNRDSVTKVFWIDPRDGGQHNTHYQDQVAYIMSTPIPAAIWLFGSALAGLVGVSRRNKAERVALVA